MARQKKKAEKAGENVVDYRHKGVKRLNIPPAGLTARGEIVREKKIRYAYNPHLSPVLPLMQLARQMPPESWLKKPLVVNSSRMKSNSFRKPFAIMSPGWNGQVSGNSSGV